MIKTIEKALERFLEGFSLTPDEQREFEEAERKNAENDEAIKRGYSVSSRKTAHPEIPDFLARVRRGIHLALEGCR